LRQNVPRAGLNCRFFGLNDAFVQCDLECAVLL
jgi:hypothetical protein